MSAINKVIEHLKTRDSNLVERLELLKEQGDVVRQCMANHELACVREIHVFILKELIAEGKAKMGQ